MAKKRKMLEILLRSVAIAGTRKTILALIALNLNQKTSSNLGNLYVSDRLLDDPLMYNLHLISSLVSENLSQGKGFNQF